MKFNKGTNPMGKRIEAILRPVISWLVNFTPNHYYYSSCLHAEVDEVLVDIAEGRQHGKHSVAAISLICATETLFKEHDAIECKMVLTGVEDTGNVMGDFEVTIKRIHP